MTKSSGGGSVPACDSILKGRYCAIVREPFESWVIGRLSGVRGKAPEVFEDRVFTSLDEVEWEVFRLRWKQLTGEDLEI